MLKLRREFRDDYGRKTIRPSGLVWFWVVYNSLAIPAVVIEMGGIGMVEDPVLAQIFLCSQTYMYT